MRTFYTIIFCLVLSFAKAQQPIDTLITYITFENLKGYSKGYGTSIDRPVGSGAFVNLADRGALQISYGKAGKFFQMA
ncbi:hypothetical protein [Pedobacter agri]|uniref:hypothetical protein n=1 Tax=Pedobacter agri TaxID=454586 RepID=UPI00292DC9EF|nr:hypothetical protein [Pedobacter agri]